MSNIDKINQSDKIKRILDNAWLLNDTISSYNIKDISELEHLSDKLLLNDLPVEEINPFKNAEVTAKDLMRVLRDPNNFFYTCKLLFNINLMPFQLLMLKELWNRPFPMIIASRGGGKCINGNSIIVTPTGFRRIDSFAKNATPHTKVFHDGLKVLGENGFKDVEYAWSNGFSETIKVRTRMGFEEECTYNHPMRVVRNGKIDWVNTEDIKIGDRIVIDRSTAWFDKPNNLPEDLAYALGLIVGDGGYTIRGSIGFTTADEELANSLNNIWEKYFDKTFKKSKLKYQWYCYSVKIWDDLFQVYGFNSPVCAEKDVPESIWSAPKKSVAAFIRGLFDADGCIEKQSIITLSAKSSNIVKHIQFLLTRFGIISRIKKRLNKKYDRYYYYLTISGKAAKIFMEEIGFGLTRKSDKAKFLKKKSNSNVDTIPDELVHPLIFEMRQELRKLIGPAVKFGGVNKEFKHIAPNRLKSYEMTYELLGKILEECKEKCGEFESYKKLKELYDKNYFYDRVTSLEESQCVTYDLYIPNDHSFISNGFISHNSYILALYAMLRLMFTQGCKVAIIGASFRQSKVIFEYMEKLWSDGNIYRDICGSGSGRAGRTQGPSRATDICSMVVGESVAVALPLGNGEKIRGQRANYLIADEYASINEAIYQVVVRGFASVSANPSLGVKHQAQISLLKKLNLWNREQEIEEARTLKTNQSVIAGTANYEFNHFYKMWKLYRDIIYSKGDEQKLNEVFGGPIPDNFSYRDYSIVRIPSNLLPLGFMDPKMISSAKVSMSKSEYLIEYGAAFATDSDGFYKRSLINYATCGINKILDKNGEEISFGASMGGEEGIEHVIAVDPASEKDNFSIVVLALHPDHRRIVYVWTTNKKVFQQRLKSGITKESNFYAFCARKIRDLMVAFGNVVRIIMDSQGGGYSVEEALHDEDKIRDYEQPILQIIDPNKEKPSDDKKGLHILELANFSDAKWVSNANHGMKKDFEDKVLIFPVCDPLTMTLAHEQDISDGRLKYTAEGDEIRLYDTLEDNILEIEELKNELSSIVHSETPNGNREKWGLPESSISGAGTISSKRKDRYSALLMANMCARTYQKLDPTISYSVAGGFADQLTIKKDSVLYNGPEWFTSQVNKIDYGAALFGRNR